MQKTQNITIVLLLMTAAILTSLLVASWLYTKPAYAGASARAGDYLMINGMYDTETDFVYVLDIAKGKLNLYYPNINTNALTLGCSVNVITGRSSR